MKTIEMDMGNETITTFEPIEVSLTVNRAVKFSAEVYKDDVDLIADFNRMGLPVAGRDPELGDFAAFEFPVRLVVDEETQGAYIEIGDDVDHEQEALLTVHYVGNDEGHGSLLLHLGRKKMLRFWKAAGVELMARREQATGVDAQILSLIIAVLQYVSGDDIDLAPTLNEWASAARRKCGVQIIGNLLKAA